MKHTPEEIKYRLSDLGVQIGNIAIEYITNLEQENAELKDKLKNLESVAEVRLANWQKYEQENAELKERADKADLDSVTFFNQLCKAKEIIKDFLSLGIFGIFKRTTAEEIVDKAENFLKEDKK